MDLILVDDTWQYPAITEQHAFNRLESLALESEGNAYIAFPWATYIDLVKNGKDVSTLDAKLERVKLKLIIYKRVITVCQHIRFMEFSSLFESLGITDVFWSHKTIGENQVGSLSIHSFPLFPVQVADNVAAYDKKYLYSFVGARSNQWYLTQSRNWIIDHITSSDDVVIKGRDTWHYNDLVYKQQVKGESLDQQSMSDNTKHSEEYLDILCQSKYALCPSGSGPNSIRLWECFEAGVIPILLSDKYDSPAEGELFENSIVRVTEDLDSVKAIDEKIRSISEEEYNQYKNNVDALKLMYGKDGFVYDIVQLVFNIEHVDFVGDFSRGDPMIYVLELTTSMLCGLKVPVSEMPSYRQAVDACGNQLSKDYISMCKKLIERNSFR